MFNEQRLEEIRKKISASTLLDDHEKADWLNLLPLMNDKQLTDLEGILGAQTPVAPAQPVQAAPPLAKPPIAPGPEPLAPRPLTQSDPNSITSTPAPGSNAPQIPPSLPPLSHLANIPKDVTQPAQSIPVPIPSAAPLTPPTPAPEAKHTTKRPTEQFQLEKVEDLKNLSADTLRQFDWQSLVKQIKNAIAEQGYFHVLQFVESSPLYDSYISSGKNRLAGQESDLTQEEFEFMTDLLSHMRFNRL